MEPTQELACRETIESQRNQSRNKARRL